MIASNELIEQARALACDTAAVERAGNSRMLAALAQTEQALREACERYLAEPEEQPLPQKAAWLLDNYAFVQSQISEVREAMPPAYCRKLPLSGDQPRIYRIAAHLGAVGVNPEDLAQFINAYQETSPLTLAEVWAIGPMLKLALIERLREAVGQASRPVRTGREACPTETVVRETITALHALEAFPWRDFTESVSITETILRDDPAGIYAGMDFETRDLYRHVVEDVSRHGNLDETGVAALAVKLADSQPAGPESHVGYYLAGPGLKTLRQHAGYRQPIGGRLRDFVERRPNLFYFGGAAFTTLLLIAAVYAVLAPVPLRVAPLLLVPASHAALTFMNLLVSRLLPPRRLPRLDFSQGIPDSCRTFVVVPTLLLSRGGVQRLLERLEIHYLGNPDPNLSFVLLTDFPDSPYAYGDNDNLLDVCAKGIELLNARYSSAGSPFYLFHRRREWNESEAAWMGHERKRGKLEDFNRLLLGADDAFSLKVGDLSALPSFRYVITLDSDTQLPRDTARKLIATLAHPLNRPVIDPETRTVREGYAILQPRITVSMESAGRSRLAQFYSGQTGFDPYTTAVSDVYQDLYGRASFTGKGIYDLRAFDAVLGGRFPENALLSHDLIEGEHARTGLVTDLEFIDDYPAKYQAWSKRKHRWVRGDWQIARWLLPSVPAKDGRRERNPLPAISRWKIADNLRRSTYEISVFALLVAGWFGLPQPAYRWTLLAIAFLLLPTYFEAAWALLRLPPRRFWRSYLRETGFRFMRGHAEALLNITFVVHQALLMADAVLRTLVRVLITRKKLLEWESMAQTEESRGRKAGLLERYLLAGPVLAVFACLWVPALHAPDVVAVAVLELWLVSPLIAFWLNGAPASPREASSEDADYLRDVALRTWRYFSDLSGPEQNWLVPDNVQEDPPRTACRASPTNIGLLAAANLAAGDLGYLTHTEFALRLEGLFDTMARLPRHRGHFYNWYDTNTLRPLPPLYVSSVDSGNLAAALLTVKQGCLEMLRSPVIGRSTLAGMRDHCLRLRSVLPTAARSSSISRLLASLVRQLEYEPTDLFFWESVLAEVRVMSRTLRPHLEWTCEKLEPGPAAEAQYWYDALVTRIEAALGNLSALAPWLAPPFDPEFRLHAKNPVLRDLMTELERVPPIGQLPKQYTAIDRAAAAVLASPAPIPEDLRTTLQDLQAALGKARAHAAELIRRLKRHAALAERFFTGMDFAFLLDGKRKLLRVGCDADTGALDSSCYDLLASEARSAVFVAIAKGDLPREAWFRLGRKLASYQGTRTLYSWTGTMFEYLMPALFMRSYENTLLGESLESAVKIQQAYGAERGVPWGISEAAYSARDSTRNYQYRAFGVPDLGLKRTDSADLVVAPYASMLALSVDRAAATANLRAMETQGWTGRYGFYESADFRFTRAAGHPRSVVRAFMAHHQAMGLLALANALLDSPMQRRFHTEPLVQATEFLLQERVPALFDSPPVEQPLPEALSRRYDRLKSRPAAGTIAGTVAG